MKMIRLNVTLNGSMENPYHLYGLRQNPFPSEAVYESRVAAYERILSCLLDPIKDVAEVRERLEDYYLTEEFIAGCCERFVPGKIVHFSITFPE